jgi:hypothetical protein
MKHLRAALAKTLRSSPSGRATNHVDYKLQQLMKLTILEDDPLE